ncbi:MAG: N-methyl-L-tryptophan oxidase [Xenococcaceae cyanobacterium]
MTRNFDIIVLGAGGVGSAAAYYLARAQQRVLLLEQFALNHQKGSSYGSSRVIRYAYDHPIYINLMRAAYPLWLALEEEIGDTLYVQTGELDFGFPEAETFNSLAASMDQAKLPYERLSTAEIQKRFPQFKLESGMEGLYQADTGLLKASKCVLAHAHLAQKHGATLLEKTPVTKIKPGNNRVEVKTHNETYNAQIIVIAAGSWNKNILADLDWQLPLTIMPCQLGFIEPDNYEEFKPGRFPVFLAHMKGDYGEMPYGLPLCDHTGVKISTFYGWETVDDVSEVDYTPSSEWIEKMRGFYRQYIPGASGKLVETRRCLYTMTPDKHFVLDRHPAHDNIFIGAGFSGHGFKFTTLVGSILADWAIKGETEHDTSLFKGSRFS